MYYIHTIEYYSAIKRSDGLTDATTWTSPENLCQVKEAKRPQIILFHLYKMFTGDKSIETESNSIFLGLGES